MEHTDYNTYPDNVSYTSPPISRSPVDLQEKAYDEDSHMIHKQETMNTSYHPFSLIVIILWILLIAGEIILLERSVAVAPTVASLPWYYANDGLPSVLLTIFAQGHAPITAMHFSRLAVSALQYQESAPRTWLEMFWLADKKYDGPVGILVCLWKILRHPMRISPTLVFFFVTIISALTTPLVLNRAYPTQPLDVPINRPFIPNTLSAAKLAQIDAYAQSAVGAGSWATNLTVLELFNATTFVSVTNRSRVADASDFFFTGDVQGMDAILPGVRIQGRCFPLYDQTNLTKDSFSQLCQEQLPTIGDRDSMPFDSEALDVNVSYCTTGQYAQVTLPSNTSALVWFQNTNVTNLVGGDLAQGTVRCDTVFTTGRALLSGRNLTFENFVEDDKLYVPNKGSEPIHDPLYTALYYLTGLQHGIDEQEAQLFGMLGYDQTVDGNADQVYLPPSVDSFAAAMWRGATHMTMALAVLSRESDTVYNGTAYVSVSARTRDTPFLIGALVLLGIWLLAVAGLTAAVWRPTAHGDSLNSYCAARLAVDRPDLVSGDKFGGISDNKRLWGRFDPIDMDI